MPPHLADRIANYDLHLHTCWSYDATTEVAVYFERAAALDVGCIAITDHHLMDAWPEVAEAAKRYPQVRAIPAAELTVTTRFGGVDLLCYGLPTGDDATFAGLMTTYRRWQQEAGAAISTGMRALGYDFTDEARLALLRSYRPQRVIERQGSTHVKSGLLMRHCIERGYADDQPGYALLRQAAGRAQPVPPHPAAEYVAESVHACGGVIVIAHPQPYFHGDDRARMDALREQCQFDGIECAHPNVDPALTPIYEAYCREHGLVCTAGSDSHTAESAQTIFARHRGQAEWLEPLLERLDQHTATS
jgi:predicted metal-dependent phosphoesterase TrpH